MLIFLQLTSHMRTLVDVGTTSAFLSAPLLALLNHHVITTASLPAFTRPPQWLVAPSWTGVPFLLGFSVLFLVLRFGYSCQV